MSDQAPTRTFLVMTIDDYHVTMKSVRIADLKARLSEHLRYVRRGHVLTILERDRPIAKVVPIDEESTLTVRVPAPNAAKLRDVPIPRASRVSRNPVAVLLEDREGGR